MIFLKRKRKKKFRERGSDFLILLFLVFCISLGFFKFRDKKYIFVLDIKKKSFERFCNFFFELFKENYLFCFFIL